MTEQALIEKIAEEGVNLYAFPNLWNRLNKTEKDNWRQWAKVRILPILKEAGYKSPEEAAEFGLSVNEAAFAQARVGYVKLAKDQTIPLMEIKDAQYVVQALLEAGWRKVELG